MLCLGRVYLLRTQGLLALSCLFFSASIGWAQDLFPDKGLEAVVRREVFEKRYNSEPLTADDVKNISQVIGKGKGIKSLEGLQHCKALMKLDLENNEIADLTPIKDLKLLQSIDWSGSIAVFASIQERDRRSWAAARYGQFTIALRRGEQNQVD
jgi:hypothetical protein